MTDDLKSFRKDWRRWSSSERFFAAFFVLATSLALIGGALAGVVG